MHRRTVIVCFVSLVSILAVTVVTVPGARAAPKAGSFAYHAGDRFLAGINKAFSPDNATSGDNGDYVLVMGTGTFDSVAKTATGGGTFEHHHADGSLFASGTWTASSVIYFNSYGSGSAQGLPASFWGGRLVLRILLAPELPGNPLLAAQLTITCALGSPPAGSMEGIKIVVGDFITFNLSTGGATVFIVPP